MLLSDENIIKLISNGELKITNCKEQEIKSASICLHLSSRVLIPIKCDREIDIRHESTYPKYSTLELDSHKGFSINPGDFFLAATNETITLPNSVAGLLSNISGLARLGLNTILSNYISPGYGEGTPKSITLEIHNISNTHIRVFPGMRICHLLLIQLLKNTKTGYDIHHPGKYVGSAPQGSEYFKNTGLS
ncbi:dCTP deaminase [Escherichia coli]|nr:dCTP deaminase [Escherichia coli]